MKFRTKLILGFSTVVFFISAIMGILYYRYNSQRITQVSRQNMEFYSQQLAESIDAAIESMKQLTDYILSDQDMLSAMQAIPKYHQTGNDYERKNQVDILTSGISTYYISRNFYRVIIFNELGDIATSTNAGEMIINKARDISEIPWLEEAAELHGRPLIVAPHEDGWSARKEAQVFSLARKVQGGDFGYIEVQCEAEKLAAVFSLPDDNTMVAAWLPDGTLLYQSEEMSGDALAFYYEQGDEEARSITVDGKRQIIAAADSASYGIRVAVVQNTVGLLQDMKQSLILAAGLALSCFAISMAMVVFIASKLSSPITSLRRQMENTRLENLDEPPIILNTDDEMEALGKAYQQMTNRLNESIIKERRLSILQLQAQFDTLQAQVNPHFLYNVLNVISSRGIASGDEEICEICGSLAAMLRYSTNTVERYATLKQEMEYLEKYVFLLKSRYSHRLEVQTQCDPAIAEEILPKIVLQQLVENSVQHGFVSSMSVMKIQVRGWRDEKGWFVEVQDNGQGITDEIMKNLNDKIESVRSKILMKRSSIEMEIGGMGLANTYARMFLLYADRTVFQIRNLEEGMSIVIGVKREE